MARGEVISGEAFFRTSKRAVASCVRRDPSQCHRAGRRGCRVVVLAYLEQEANPVVADAAQSAAFFSVSSSSPTAAHRAGPWNECPYRRHASLPDDLPIPTVGSRTRLLRVLHGSSRITTENTHALDIWASDAKNPALANDMPPIDLNSFISADEIEKAFGNRPPSGDPKTPYGDQCHSLGEKLSRCGPTQARAHRKASRLWMNKVRRGGCAALLRGAERKARSPHGTGANGCSPATARSRAGAQVPSANLQASCRHTRHSFGREQHGGGAHSRSGPDDRSEMAAARRPRRHFGDASCPCPTATTAVFDPETRETTSQARREIDTQLAWSRKCGSTSG